MEAEMCDYLINGLSLNKGITTVYLEDFSFNENCTKSWPLCFAVNNTISDLNSNYRFNI